MAPCQTYSGLTRVLLVEASFPTGAAGVESRAAELLLQSEVPLLLRLELGHHHRPPQGDRSDVSV